jgi:hypothetical protein
MSRTRPLALSDDQLFVIQRMAEPLHPRDRGAYLLRVAELLGACEIGDGAVARAAARAQKELFDPPQLGHAVGAVSKYR